MAIEQSFQFLYKRSYIRAMRGIALTYCGWSRKKWLARRKVCFIDSNYVAWLGGNSYQVLGSLIFIFKTAVLISSFVIWGTTFVLTFVLLESPFSSILSLDLRLPFCCPIYHSKSTQCDVVYTSVTVTKSRIASKLVHKSCAIRPSTNRTGK